MKRICMVGSGYVGLVSGACFAEMGHRVVCVDNDASKISALKKGKVPIYEPGLDQLLKRNVARKRISFAGSVKEGIKGADVVFIAVGTPSRADGSADLTYVEQVAREVAENIKEYTLIVEKSTVPVQTGQWVAKTVARYNKRRIPFDVASNPEFLREGTAIHDFMNPDRIVLGVSSKRAETLLKEVYAPLKARVIVTDLRSAEIIKHASNSFLATKISFINAVAQVCEKVGADVTQVAEGMGFDPRIGRSFLNAGIGFGGFCLPKDIEAFLWISKQVGAEFHLLREVQQINERQKDSFVKKVEEALWILKNKTIGVWGLSFKPNTDDLRYAPSLDILKRLAAHGARFQIYDPVSMVKARKLLGKPFRLVNDPYAAAKGADCLLILTEWDAFKNADLKRVLGLLRNPIVIDGRNLFDPERMDRMGFEYRCIGRSSRRGN